MNFITKLFKKPKPEEKQEIVLTPPWSKFRTEGLDYDALVIEYLNDYAKNLLNIETQFKRMLTNEGTVLFESDIVHDGYDKLKLEMYYKSCNFYMSCSKSPTTCWYSLDISKSRYDSIYRILLNDDMYYQIHYDITLGGTVQRNYILLNAFIKRLKEMYDYDAQLSKKASNEISLECAKSKKEIMKFSMNPLRKSVTFEYGDEIEEAYLFTEVEVQHGIPELISWLVFEND